MSTDTQRIEQLEKVVQTLSTKVDYLATQLGFKPQMPGFDSSELGQGQRQIPGDPRRTETGMGAILDPSGSKFL